MHTKEELDAFAKATSEAQEALKPHHDERAEVIASLLRFAVSDVGKEHLLRRDGNWYKLPIRAGDRHLLVLFGSRQETEQFCAEKEGGCFCEPFEITD